MDPYFLVLVGFLACVNAHIYALGSIGPGPNSKDFFISDAQSPCPVAITDDSRLNVNLGQAFVINWALIVNHNIPPSPNGIVRFRWSVGVPTSKSNFTDLGPYENIINQPVNYYYTFDAVIPAGDTGGRGTLQVIYDINGAEGPFQTYYQCINFFVLRS